MTTLDELEVETVADLRTRYDRARESWANGVARAMVAWGGLLELPEPSRCRVCGARMDEVMVWNSDRAIGYACPNWHDGDFLRRRR